jgi:putative phosphoribosyl transferase
MRAAIAAARKAGAMRVTVALPVAPKETCEELAAEADDVRCLWQPDWFQSVGAYYRHFPQVSDAQVQEALALSLFAMLTHLQPLLQPQAHQQLRLLVDTVFTNGLAQGVLHSDGTLCKN